MGYMIQAVSLNHDSKLILRPRSLKIYICEERTSQDTSELRSIHSVLYGDCSIVLFAHWSYSPLVLQPLGQVSGLGAAPSSALLPGPLPTK